MNETQNTSATATTPTTTSASASTSTSTSTSTHTGKIGRLPHAIRDQLGHRIEDGRPGAEIVQWLNDQPQVKTVLAEFFGGRPINEQNLSDWKQSGHLDWLRRQDSSEAAQRLVEFAADLEHTSGTRSLCDRFAVVLAAEMMRVGMALFDAETDLEKRWKRLCEIQRQLSQLRRDDHRSLQLAMRREQWTLDVKRQTRAQAQAQAQAQARTQVNGKDKEPSPLSEMFLADLLNEIGQGAKGGQFASSLASRKFGLYDDAAPFPSLNGHAIKANKA
jgi:hypothetical protein